MVRLTSTPAYHGSGPVMYYPPHPGPLLLPKAPVLFYGEGTITSVQTVDRGFTATTDGGNLRTLSCVWGPGQSLLLLASVSSLLRPLALRRQWHSLYECVHTENIIQVRPGPLGNAGGGTGPGLSGL